MTQDNVQKISKIFNWIISLCVLAALIAAGLWVNTWLEESRVLRQVIERLSAETRVAEVLVTKSEFDESTEKIRTTIKFLEYDVQGSPLEPRYYSFNGNVIQFQALVIRFNDEFIKAGDRLKGKSAYLFTKAFVLDGKNTQEFEITKVNEVPAGYQIDKETSLLERTLWQSFWEYALDPEKQAAAGVKNAQIEAPGSMFLPGTIYTIHLEHDGGLRIDAQPVPQILKGETV